MGTTGRGGRGLEKELALVVKRAEEHREVVLEDNLVVWD